MKIPTTDFLTASSLDSVLQIQDIQLFATDFILQNYHDTLYQELDITLPLEIKSAVNKRKAEYLAGRYVATQALRSIGVNALEVPTGLHRSPIFPQSVVASITHTNSTALCAAALSENINQLGIDLETILKKSTINAIEHSIINTAEKKVLCNLRMPYQHAFSLTFSAKESLFKALYPSVKNYFDFGAAKLVQVNESDNNFELELTENLTPTLNEGMNFSGIFHFDKSNILTIIYEK